MKARNGPDERVTVLGFLIAQRESKWNGRPFAEWVAEHHDGIQAGIDHYLELGDTESNRQAYALFKLAAEWS